MLKLTKKIVNKITTKLNYKTIYFDSWENDNEVDPLISLTKSIANASNNRNVKNILKTIAPFISTVLQTININVDAKEVITKFLEDEDSPKNAVKNLNNELIGICDRIVIFIDELGRCRLSYAMKFLERIQHCFTNDKITFVFSVNLTELSKNVRKFYGNGYLKSFFRYCVTYSRTRLN